MTRVFDEVAAFTLTRGAGDFPASALSAAARMMLDTMGIAIAAAPMEAGRIARDSACLMFNSDDPSARARMMFDGRQAGIPGAAFALASQIDNLDGHDGYNPTKGHIGVVVLPTLATLMQVCPDMSGPEALAAVTVGYEVAGRAAMTLHVTVSDYHTSGAWNALGVVAMAARMRGMGRRRFREALGIAEYHGPRSQMMREIANPTMLHDGSGWGALVGLSSAMMAERGFTGAPAITIEAEEAAPFWEDLGQFWQVEHQYVKPYPICRWAHGSIDAVRSVVLAHGLAATDIARVEVRSFHQAACLFDGVPDTTSKAQYSLRFAVAAYLTHGTILVDQISGAGLSDPAVIAMMERITVAEDKRHSDRFPLGRWADVTIVTSDGRRLDSGDVHARGGPEAPFSDGDVIAKYHSFADPVVGAERAGRIRDAILGLTEAGSRLSDLAPLIFEAP